MRQLYVSLLGELVAHYEGSPPIRFTSRKEQELFCFLLTKRDHALPREGLATVLWGDTTTARSRKYLRTALWHLRSDLSCADADDERIFTTSGDRIRLCPDADIWTDVRAVEQASEHVQALSDQYECSSNIEPLLEAVALYKGDFLDGWYQGWCLYERERIQQIYFRLIDGLMAICEGRHDFDRGLSLGLRLLTQEPTREGTYRRLMRLYYLSGDRCSALRHYQHCVSALREELDIAPSPMTRTLYEQIRACTLDRPAPFLGAEASADKAGALRPVLDQLGSIQATLEAIQQELRRMTRTASEAKESPSD